jgi:hypothetical protein
MSFVKPCNHIVYRILLNQVFEIKVAIIRPIKIDYFLVIVEPIFLMRDPNKTISFFK